MGRCRLSTRKNILAWLGLLGLVMPMATTAADGGSFSGITIIELVDRLAAGALIGRQSGDASYIVSYVSNKGSYAALLSEAQKPLCIAWAVPGSITDKTVAFGLPPSGLTLEKFGPICMPFTLSYIAEGNVRLSADNPYSERFGPLSNRAKTMHYDHALRLIARIPMVDIDWEMAPFQNHTVEDVRLGPFQGPRNPAYPVATGFEMKGDTYGWESDILYGVLTGKPSGQKFTTDVFEASALERYGNPSIAIPGIAEYRKELYWLYDLQGNKADIPGQDNCSATFDFWKHEERLAGYHDDIGPWGCSLVMLLIHNGNGVRPRVSSYTIEAVSGHMLALKHFTERIKKTDTIREQIEEIQSFRPQL